MDEAEMGIVVSLADTRNSRIKNTLLVYALEGETAIVETQTSLIAAEKILCRETFAEMFNSLGNYFAVSYSDIRDIRPAAVAVQTSTVNASGNWIAAPESMPHTSVSTVLRFPNRSRRKTSMRRPETK